MRFKDFSPATVPSLDQQQDALQKGLGRSMQWASAGQLADDAVLDACLNDKRFDMQCEDNRGEWLWGIVTTIGAVERFRGSILNALQTVTADSDAYQLCELGLHYAKNGCDEFKTQLYEFVERRPGSSSPWIGEGQLIELDGEEAFKLITQIRGNLLNAREWEWDDTAVVDRAIEKLGEARVHQLLETSANPATRRFADGWKLSQIRTDDPGLKSHEERMRAITVSEVIDAAPTMNNRHWFRGWGHYASESDLEVVLQILWTTKEPTVLANLLRVFSNRPLPRFDPRLISLCEHSDTEVRRWASKALEMNSDPLIREYGFSQLREPTSDIPPVGLLIRNFVTGDEWRLLELVDLPNDPSLRHWTLMDVRKVLEENSESDCSQLGVICYAETPCEVCRCDAAKMLIEDGVAPKWLTDELLQDSSEDCRELVRKQSLEVQQETD